MWQSILEKGRRHDQHYYLFERLPISNNMAIWTGNKFQVRCEINRYSQSLRLNHLKRMRITVTNKFVPFRPTNQCAELKNCRKLNFLTVFRFIIKISGRFFSMFPFSSSSYLRKVKLWAPEPIYKHCEKYLN